MGELGRASRRNHVFVPAADDHGPLGEERLTGFAPSLGAG